MDYIFVLETGYHSAIEMTEFLSKICFKVIAVTVTNHTLPPFICVHTIEELTQEEYNMVKCGIGEHETRFDVVGGSGETGGVEREEK